MKATAFFALSALALVAAAPPPPTQGPAAVRATLADPARDPKLKDLDASRKPAEVIAFLGLRPGMAVADMFTGSGYWTPLFAKAVGPRGSVTAYEPTQFYKGEGKAAIDALVAATPGASLRIFPFERWSGPARAYDAALINLDFHDLYWVSEKYGIGRSDPRAFTKAMYAAMKPGGVVGVIDHVGPAGDTRALVDQLHRIDPKVVKADFLAAGFKLEAETNLLANPADDHSKNVFDPAIRGKTDRFFYKFRKPRR
jgi:predicted methyltransferase